MEQVYDSRRRNLILPSSSPSFVLIHGKDGNKKDEEIMTFHPIHQDHLVMEDYYVTTRKVPNELQNKDIKIQFGCDTWLIVWNTTKEEEEDNNKCCQYSLWNAADTMENPRPIYFPEFKLKLSEHKIITGRLLTAPPGDPNCMLLVFGWTEKDGPSLSYCREGAEDWTNHLITHERLSRRSAMYSSVMLNNNGKIYCLCKGSDFRTMVADIDIIKPDDDSALNINFSDFIDPSPVSNYAMERNRYLVESRGELFLIDLDYYEKFDKEPEMLDVGLYKWDPLSNKQGETQKIENFKDMAFFVNPMSKFSCLANNTEDDMVLGNHIYFTLNNRLYAFNMEAQTTMMISIPNVSQWLTCLWVKVKLNLRLSDDSDDDKEEEEDIINPKENQEIIVKQSSGTTIKGDFSKLPFDILVEIGKWLKLQDYMNFRSVNTLFKMVAPLNIWRTKSSSLKERFQGGCISSPPMLMPQQIRSEGGVWQIIDPLHKVRYFLTHEDNEFQNAKMCYSKGGWCAMIDKHSILLWNPFTKKTIQLPEVGFYNTITCSFSSLPDSRSCTIVLGANYGSNYTLYVIKLGSNKWIRHPFKISSNFGLLSTDNGPMLYKGSLYFLDENGNLGVYNDDDYQYYWSNVYNHGDPDTYYEILNRVVVCPCETFHQAFLLECDEKLLSVFVSFSGHRVQVFELDESHLVWRSRDNLGNHTIYLSCSSSFSITTSQGMQNRIYFPRYYGERGIVYYSLESRMLHSDDTDEVLENFYFTKEQAFCSWITPTF